jgi:hypothetical protein
MPTKFGKFSSSGNKAYTPKARPPKKAPPPKANAGRVRDVSQPMINALGGFRRLGSPGIKKFYGA